MFMFSGGLEFGLWLFRLFSPPQLTLNTWRSILSTANQEMSGKNKSNVPFALFIILSSSIVASQVLFELVVLRYKHLTVYIMYAYVCVFWGVCIFIILFYGKLSLIHMSVSCVSTSLGNFILFNFYFNATYWTYWNIYYSLNIALSYFLAFTYDIQFFSILFLSIFLVCVCLLS